MQFDSLGANVALGYQGASAGIGVSFRPKRYTLSPSVPEEPLATALAAQSVVFVYCETRSVHLALNGADIMEIMCLHRLCELGVRGGTETEMHESQQPQIGINNDNTVFGISFVHARAIERLPTWRSSYFTSASGDRISGDSLVRDAGKRIAELITTTKGNMKKPLYWNLHHLLIGSAISGLDAPIDLVGMSWLNIWKHNPFPIIAVGRINAELIDIGSQVQLPTFQPHFAWFRRWGPHSENLSENLCRGPLNFRPGGLLSDAAIIKQLVSQSLKGTVVNKGKWSIPGRPEEHCYVIYEAENHVDNLNCVLECVSCTDVREGQRCLHYIY